ncbi:hypothetical protein FOZ63_002689 [Perkinsus olseni]|uniref:tRNA-splicing endonuclease subunit Sen54 N-terminal domain-containing protein n=1 Tax=Perkinsus olseni TaxID=32597 RepID=A0A7J6S401_PEROL|nr:hypothetical protein FOZ63_002689 [Perkinsus olseni]
MSEESPCVDEKRGELIVTEQLLRSQLAGQEQGESRGVWDAEACKVTVTSRSGKALQSIAPNRRDLNLEEALYLAERGSLVVDLRVKDLWRLLERMGQKAVDAYLVYANLKRAGYDVQRGKGFEDRQPPLLFTVTTSDSAAVRGEFDVVVVSSAYTRFGEAAELPTDREAVVAVVEMGTVMYLAAESRFQPPQPTLDGAVRKRRRF